MTHGICKIVIDNYYFSLYISSSRELIKASTTFVLYCFVVSIHCSYHNEPNAAEEIRKIKITMSLLVFHEETLPWKPQTPVKGDQPNINHFG